MATKRAGKRVDMLSARFVETVKEPGLYGDGGNLFLKVDDSGNKSWIVRWQDRDGKQRKLGLGPVHTVPLAEARDKAADARRLILDGIDPREARREAKAAIALAEAKALTFDECAEKFIEANKAGWKNAKHADQWRATLKTYASPVFGSLPIAAVDVGLVVDVLTPIWSTKNETAHRVRGRVESILDWAKVQNFRTGENPARWKGHLDKVFPARRKVRKVQHHAALPYDQLPAFMVSLRERYGVSTLALEFTILTACRTNEVLDARWTKIDFKNKIWTIPGEKMKGGKIHRVPLCDRAVAIVEDMKTDKRGDYIFPGAKRSKPLSNMAMLNVLSRMGHDEITVHGFRSTFRDWVAEQTNFPREIAEVALAHDVGDETEQAYQRGDMFEKRKRLMTAWAKYCEKPPVKIKSGDNVVELRP
jgi:integrase